MTFNVSFHKRNRLENDKQNFAQSRKEDGRKSSSTQFYKVDMSKKKNLCISMSRCS